MADACAVQIAMPNDVWMRALPDFNDFVAKVVYEAIRSSGRVFSDSEVSVVLSDDRELRILNKEYRGIDQATNVLSFPGEGVDEDEDSFTFLGRPRMLGDILLAFETTQREAAAEGKALRDHVAHLLVHGALHLLGYDHERDADAEVMERLERDILEKMGIADPYEIAASPKPNPKVPKKAAVIAEPQFVMAPPGPKRTAKAKPKAATKPKPSPTVAKAKAKPVAKSKAVAKAKPTVKSAAKTKPKAKPAAKPKPKPKAKPAAMPKPRRVAKSKPAAKARKSKAK